jgi:hypothetical protein
MSEHDARRDPMSTCYAPERPVPLTSTPRSDHFALAHHLPIPDKGLARRQCIAGWERIPVILSCSSVSIAIGNRTKHYRRPVRVPLSRRRRRVLARQSSYSAIWLDAGDVGRAFHGLELGRYLLVGKAKSNDGSGMQISSEKSSRIGPQDRMTV